MTAQPKAAEEQEPEVPALPPVRDKLNQPKRAFIALAELLVVAGLIWLAFWLWPKGMSTITTVLDGGRTFVSHRYYGHWMSLAIFAGTIGGLLLIDAIRQLMLAARARPKHAK